MTPRERLERLVVVLQQVDAKKYDQSTLGRAQKRVDESIEDWFAALAKVGLVPEEPIPVHLQAIACHTEACALGWGAFDPVLQAEGLAWYRITRQPFDRYRLPSSYYIVNTSQAGLDLETFFGISSLTEQRFFGSGNANLYQKIQQIQHYLDTGQTVCAETLPVEA